MYINNMHMIYKNIVLALFSFCTIQQETIALTAYEKDIAFQFFTEKLDTANIIMYNHSFGLNTIQALTIANKIFFNSDVNYAENREQNTDLFIHELTHVWQYQHNSPFNSNIKIYTYEINNNLEFKDYGAEQQASLMEDYYNYHNKAGFVSSSCSDCIQLTDEEINRRMQDLYENMLRID